MHAKQFQMISKAIADARRFEILERIANVTEMACAKLADDLPVSQATISHHLKELSDAGLVDVRREAKFAYFRLERKVWSAYLKALRDRTAPKTRKRSSES